MPMDRHAQKQVLLARIAYQRIELRRDLARVREAARVPQLVRAALGGGAWGRALFGAGGTRGAGWLGHAWSLLRRYRVVATLLGAVAPALAVHSRWRRIFRLAVLGAAVVFGWRAARTRKH